MNYHWNWGIFFETSPDGVHTYLQTLLLGTGWTLATAILAWCMALTLGALVGVIRTTPHPWLVRLGDAYVELFRNIPLLVQMFLWYFVLPEVLPVALGDWLKQLPDASFYTAVVSLGFYTSARVAEQVRAGILSLARGQRLRRNRNLQAAVAARTEHSVGLDDLIKLETVREQRRRIEALRLHHQHETAHPFFPTGAKRRHDPIVAKTSRKCLVRHLQLA